MTGYIRVHARAHVLIHSYGAPYSLHIHVKSKLTSEMKIFIKNFQQFRNAPNSKETSGVKSVLWLISCLWRSAFLNPLQLHNSNLLIIWQYIYDACLPWLLLNTKLTTAHALGMYALFAVYWNVYLIILMPKGLTCIMKQTVLSIYIHRGSTLQGF